MVRNILLSVHDNGALKAPTTSETESVEESIPISNKTSSVISIKPQSSKSLHCEVNQNMPFCTTINDIKESIIENPILISRKKSSYLKTEVVDESLPTTSIDPSSSTIALTDSAASTKTNNKLDTKMAKRVAYLQVEIKRKPSRKVIHIPP